METEILTASEQTVGAVASGLYQGILLAVLVGVCLRLCRRTNAATRHAVWFATLLLVVSLIPAHLLVGYFGSAVGTLAPQSASLQNPLPAAGEMAAASRPDYGAAETADSPRGGSEQPDEFFGIPLPDGFFADRVSAAGTTNLAELPVATAEVVPPLSEREIEDELLGSSPGEVAGPQNELVDASAEPLTVNSDAPALQSKSRRWIGQTLKPLLWSIGGSAQLPRSAGFWLLVAWLVAAGLRVAFLVWRLGQLRRLKMAAQPATGDLRDLFERLRDKLALKRPVQLKVSSTQRSPVLLGFVHPVILVPQVAGAVDLEETEHILRHELAHVARRDDWINLAQQLLKALVFYHPAVCWISRQLSLEREIACDDCVLDQGGRPRTYALILANLAGRIQSAAPLLAPGVSTSKSQLQQRIIMILNTRRNSSPRLAKTRLGFIASTAVLAAVGALYAAPRLVLAQTPSVAVSSLGGGASLATSGEGTILASSGDALLVIPATTPTRPGAVSLAQAGASGQPSAGISRGPKPKPENDSEDAPSAPPAPAAPEPPTPPVAPTAPAPPTGIPCPPSPAVTAAPRAVGNARVEGLTRLAQVQTLPKAGSSLEQRLERVERMLESLMAQQNSKTPSPDVFAWKWAQPWSGNQFDADAFKESVKRQAERAAEQAKRAEEQMKRAAEQQQRAKRDAEVAGKNLNKQMDGMRKQDFQKHLENFRKAREKLEREMERLDRQIEKMESEQEGLDEQGSNELEKAQPDEEEELAGPETAKN